MPNKLSKEKRLTVEKLCKIRDELKAKEAITRLYKSYEEFGPLTANLVQNRDREASIIIKANEILKAGNNG